MRCLFKMVLFSRVFISHRLWRDIERAIHAHKHRWMPTTHKRMYFLARHVIRDTWKYLHSWNLSQFYDRTTERNPKATWYTESAMVKLVSICFFESEITEYLITVDYFSNFWKVDRREDTTISTIIRKQKAHFAWYRIPCQMRLDPNSLHQLLDTSRRDGTLNISW